MHNKEGDFQADQDAQFQGTNITILNDQTKGLSKTFNFTGFTNAGYNSKLTDIDAQDYYSNTNNIKRRMNVTVQPSGGAAYTLVIKKDGQDFKKFENLIDGI